MAEQQEPHHLTCACKGVEVEIRGTPLFQSSCWCSSCTLYHQMSPVPNVMFKSDDVTVTKGEDLLKRFTVRMPNMGRYFCTECGSRVYQEVDGVGFMGVLPSGIDGFQYQPSLHVFCGDAATDALQQYKGDGLPKFRALPAKFGGSDEQVEI